MFHQIELLPIAYFTILMWVVSANVVARMMGGMLVQGTSGDLQRVLSRRFGFGVTGDEFILHLFERRVIANTSAQLLVSLMRDLARMLDAGQPILAPAHAVVLRKILLPEQYWSGCPPNHA